MSLDGVDFRPRLTLSWPLLKHYSVSAKKKHEQFRPVKAIRCKCTRNWSFSFCLRQNYNTVLLKVYRKWTRKCHPDSTSISFCAHHRASIEFLPRNQNRHPKPVMKVHPNTPPNQMLYLHIAGVVSISTASHRITIGPPSRSPESQIIKTETHFAFANSLSSPQH